MMALNPIVSTLTEYYRQIDGVRELAAYAEREALNLELVNAHAGIMGVLPCHDDGRGHFAFGGTQPSAVIEVLAEDAETVIDLCAWPITEPDRFSLVLGAASVLGAANISNPATWAFNSLLTVHKTPLAWLRADCSGVVILDHRYAPYELGRAPGPLLAQNAGHAAELRKLLCKPPVDPRQIIFPRAAIARAA